MQDFFIYPEYQDSDDLQTIKGFVSSLEADLKKSRRSTVPLPYFSLRSQRPRDGVSRAVLGLGIGGVETKCSALDDDPERIRQVPPFPLPDLSPLAGGMGMCHKDGLALSEALSLDWSIFSSLNAHNLVARAIAIYGTEEQRQRFLPRLANGGSVGGVCLLEDWQEDHFIFTFPGCIPVDSISTRIRRVWSGRTRAIND